jgi:hypothetical protein
MICKYEYKNNTLSQIFPETLSDNDFRLLNEELEIIEKKYSFVPNRIVNLQNVKTYNGNLNSIYSFVQRRIEKKYPRKILSAFLVSNDFQMGYARLFQILDTNPQASIKIFIDEAKANEWIKSQDTLLNQQSNVPDRRLYSFH